MTIRLPARMGAFACLGVALAMGLLALRDEPEPPLPSVTLSTGLPTDKLQERLRGCQLAGQAAGSDPGCLAAWAENRRRFMGGGGARPGAAEPGIAPAAPSQGDPSGDANNIQQEQ